MKTIGLILLAIGMACPALASDLEWLTSVPQAAEQARRENKTILLDFTGSDWCGWCKKLDEDTFSKPEFAAYAREHLVLVTIDFPRQKAQSAELKAANKELEQKYNVNGFPTLVSLKPDGTVLWSQAGYLRGGPAALIAKLGGDSSTPKTVAAGPNFGTIGFTQTAVTHKADGQPKLQGIFYSRSHPSSILVAGKSYGEGETVEGMKVLKIERDAVTVNWNGETRELRMN